MTDHPEDSAASTASACRAPLDARLVRELWSRTYNTQGKPDWSHIYPYYHPDIVFQDTIQRIEGKDEFIALCERLTDRCQELRMELHKVCGDGDSFFIQWTMTMIFKKSPPTPLKGCTVLTLHPDGRIVSQRDYYDLWGDIFDNIPWFHKKYRSFMRRVFG